MRSRNGNVSWQTGQEVLKKASSAGPCAAISARLISPSSRRARRNSGARAPTSARSRSPRVTMVPSLRSLLHLLHEAQNVEDFELAVGVVTADGVLLIGEGFEDRVELGHHQQVDIAPVEIQ